MGKRIRLLIVEDSPTVRDLLVRLFSADAEIEVVGTASDGEKALELLRHVRPDVVTMDISMPLMNGLEVTRRIMESHPVPVVIVSASWEPNEVAMAFRAVEAGALAVVGKPHGPGHAAHAEDVRKMVQTVKAMAEVKVVRRWARPGAPSPAMPTAMKRGPWSADASLRDAPEPAAVLIGASTGGPPVLQTLLAGLPKDYPVPVLIVQHIAAGFLPGLADWLVATTGFPVQVARHGEPLLAGHAYLAPDGVHLGVERSRTGGSDGIRLVLKPSDASIGPCPSIAQLFATGGAVFGHRVVAVLLTGMGRDGAQELKALRDQGAVTVAQDRASSVVYGMPAEAARLDAASYVLPPEQIAALLVRLVMKK